MSREEFLALVEKFAQFIEQYEKDMRGDKSLKDGDRGMVGWMREVIDYIRDYPSLTWLFAHRPLSTVGTIIGGFVGVMGLYSAGLLKLAAAVLGVSIP